MFRGVHFTTGVSTLSCGVFLPMYPIAPGVLAT